MKIRKYLLLALSTLLFLGCTPSSSSSSTPTSAASSTSKVELGDSWKESKLKLINEHLYGIEVPCMRIDGNSDLYYDEEDNDLSITGATVDSSILAEYADLFIKAGYTLTTNYEEDLIYCFEKTINYEGIERIVQADLYAESDVYYPEIDTPYFEFSLGKGVSLLEGCQSVTELSPDYLYLYEEPYEGNWVDGDKGAFSYLKIKNLNIYVSIGTYIVNDECFVQAIVNYLENTEE